MTVLLVTLVLLWALMSLMGGVNIVWFWADMKKGAATACDPPAPPPGVAVVLPIKGVHHHLGAVLEGLISQDYPNYRLILVTETERDPATEAVRRFALDHPGRIELAIAGEASQGGQKVRNQLHALGLLTDGDAAVCFADADAIPPPHWLRGLVAWLYIGRRPRLVSYYRWLLPADQRLSSMFAASINGSVATLTRMNRLNLPWGGAMILRREDADAVGLADGFQGVVSDDLRVAQLIRAHGGSIKHPYPFFVASPIQISWGGLISLCRRQYTMVWGYARPYWWLAAGSLGILAAGWLAAVGIALSGHYWAWGLLALIYFGDLGRAILRRKIGAALLPPDADGRLSRTFWADGLLSPFVHLVHAFCIWSTLGRTTVVWAGIRYDLSDPLRVRILDRSK